jgi:fumarate hydratase class I
MRDVSFLLRTEHLEQVAAILDDPEASPNDRGVALAMLKNAEVASGYVLPLCQDTGTATIVAKKGQGIWTGVKDEEYLSHGVFDTYRDENLRYSQTLALSMYDEKNSGSNLPAQIDIYATDGGEYKFLFLAKGGGSANKTYLFQETKALLNPEKLLEFLTEKMATLGTAACPPYHLAFVIGGTSAEATLKTVKLASTHYLDTLPTEGTAGGTAFRDLEMETKLLEAARKTGIGAQFGGKHFALDVRVVRLPRHGASCPVGMGVSCSAHRNIKAKINKEGIWLEQLEPDPGRFIPQKYRGEHKHKVVTIDLKAPMTEILAELTKHPVSTQVALSGTIIVAREDDHRRPRHRPREDQGASRRRRGNAAVPQGPPGLLRGPGEDAEGIAVGFVRSDHRGTHGLLRRSLPVPRRVDGDDRQGQSQPAGHRRVQEARRFLPGLHRRSRGDPGQGEHQEGRAARVPRAGHGGDLQDRGRGLSGLHPGGRQGKRLLPAASLL